MKLIFLCSCILVSYFPPLFAADQWQPEPGREQIRIWPSHPPDSAHKDIKEETLAQSTKRIGGKPYQYIRNVSQPTMTVYSPKKNSGAAILVFPGGGYKELAIDVEGTEICDWLVKANITCVLLKYRVPHSGCYWDEKTKTHVTPKVPLALQDAQRTISSLRYHAKKYNIDPNKIGVMGFSAGGNLAILSSTGFKKRSYSPIDEIDNMSSRPSFAIPVFPGHITMEHKNKSPQAVASRELNTDIKISEEVPPTLLVHAKDDPINPIYYSELYEKELKKVGVEVKLKSYKTGGHAFGVRKQGKDTDRWTEDTLAWLKEIRVI